MGDRVLVTGAYGFLGRHVARAAAAAGCEVHGVGHGAWTRAEWRDWGLADWHSGDVVMDALVAHGGDPDLIVHCAGSGSVAFSIAHPKQDFARSVDTTLDVLEYVRLHRPGATLVLPSSAGVYGRAAALPLRIDGPLHPVSPYGTHKRIAEELVQCFAESYAISAAIVRLFSVYGAGLRKQLLWDTGNRLRHGDARFGGTGTETRDWIHVDDAAALLLAAARAAAPSCPVANGAAGVGTSIRAIVERVADRLGTGGRPSFSGVARAGDPPHYVADVRQAHDWGWTPRVKLEDGIDAYVDWFAGGAW